MGRSTMEGKVMRQMSRRPEWGRRRAVAAVGVVLFVSQLAAAEGRPPSAAATRATPSSQGAPAVARSARDVARILGDYEQAAGGRRALLAIRSLIASGAIQRRQDSSPRSFSIRFLRPASVQSVEVMPAGTIDLARISTLDGSRAWSSRSALTGGDPLGSAGWDAERKAQVQSRRLALELALGIVPSLLAEGNVVTFSLGDSVRDEASGKELDRLLVADEAGYFGGVYFDTQTHLPARIDFSFIATMGRPSEVTRRTVVGDHRKVSGLVLPFSLVRGGTRIQISAYERDQPLSRDLFERVTSEAGLRRIVDAAR